MTPSTASITPLSRRLFPFLKWWPRVNAATLRADALAGMIGAIVVLPQGVAFATLAGLPPEYGLYCAMVPTVVAALFGSSLHTVAGPTNPVSLMVLATLSPLATPGTPHYAEIALTLALMSGVIMVAMGVLGLGALVNFMSSTVVVGFTAAVGVLIFASQLPNFLGIAGTPAAHFTELVAGTFSRLGDTHPWVVLVAAATLAVGIGSRRLLPKIPPLLVAMLLGSVFAFVLNQMLGAERTGLRTLGPLRGVLPPLSLPDLSPGTLQSLLGGAMAVALVSLTQAVSVAHAIALKSGQRIDDNQEFIGQGLGNIAAAFFSGFPTSTSVNRCGLNYEAGARTPMSAIFAAALLVFVLLAVGPLAAYLPIAVVAGILFLVAWSLIDFGRIRKILVTSRSESAVLAVTFFATLLLDLEFAILVGVLVSLVLFLIRTSHPIMRSLVPDPRHTGRKMTEVEDSLVECPQLKILRIEGSIYFGAVGHVERHLDTLREHSPGQKHLLLMSKSINFVDMAGAELLTEEARRRRAGGGQLYFYSLRKPVEELLERGGYMAELGRENVFRGKREAIGGVFTRLDLSICAACRARIFEECAGVPGPEKAR
ncbi:MAG TPA: SulP family inorganic anion transporter [Burkholderiales bacterium]|nr:SulP family inorganic anion transporter [Burkholderiales bacterium]